MKNFFIKHKKIIIEILIFLIFVLLAGILSVKFGLERNTDTRNYHIYNPWAFLNDRLSIDIMPAEIQTYLNPLLDIPYFLCIKYFNNHPVIITFLWGGSYALFLYIIFKISEFIFENYNKKLLAVYSVIIASGTAMVVRHIGWLSHDIFIGDLILIAIYMLLRSFNAKKNYNILIFGAGIILGCAAGFKYTAGIFVPPIIITSVIFYKQFRKPVKTILMLTCGVLAGFLITDGFWLYKLYKLFKNPFFPYFNWLFNSPHIDIANIYSLDFAKELKIGSTKLFHPTKILHDLRAQLLFILFFINLITLPLVNKDRFKKFFNINITYIDYIFTIICFSYPIWLYTFSVPRYFSHFLGLTGIITIVILLKLYYITSKMLNISNQDSSKNIFLASALIIMLIAFIPKFEIPKNDKLRRIREPIKESLFFSENLNIPNDAIVLTGRGCGILIPFQNPKAKYVYFYSKRFITNNVNLLPQNTIDKIRNYANMHPDKVYLINHEAKQKTIENLKKLGLEFESIECKHVDNSISPRIYTFCKVNITK